MHVHCASQHNGNDWNVIVSRQLVSNLDVSICIMAKIAHTVAKPIRISRSTNQTSSCRQPHYSLATCIVWCASRIMFIHTFHGFSMMANTPAPTPSSWKKEKKLFLSDSKFPTMDHEESNTRHTVVSARSACYICASLVRNSLFVSRRWQGEDVHCKIAIPPKCCNN